MRQLRIAVWVILLLMLAPLMAIPSFDSLAPIAQAASCKTSDREPYWDVEAANISIEYHSYYDYDRVDADDGFEEYYGGTFESPLGTLEEGDDFSVSQVMENDSAAGLRLNLTTGQRYQFCITAQHLHNGTILGTTNVDAYLLTSSDWNRYEMDYANRHSEWRDFTEEIPVEWRGWMGSFYWMPFRDVHAYEDSSEIQFSVALDQPQVSSSMFESQTEWEEFYLVVDGWDNMQADDSQPPGHQVQVDIQVMIEERVALPNWTVSIACCGLIIGVAAIPVVLHIRYSNSGKGSEIGSLIPAVSGTQKVNFGMHADVDEPDIVQSLHSSFDADDSGHLDEQELTLMKETLTEMGAVSDITQEKEDDEVSA